MNSEAALFTPSWARRNGFSDAGLALIWLLIAFIMFQFTAGIVAVALIMARGEITSPTDIMVAMESHMDLVFIGNSVGQITFLGIATLFVLRLHLDSELNTGQYLRFRAEPAPALSQVTASGANASPASSADSVAPGAPAEPRMLPAYLLISVLLFLAIQPTIWFVGYLNGLLPVPDLFTDLQESQYEMIQQFLMQQDSLLPALFNIAVVPAICEEILFRGYILRSFERSFKVITAILLSGFLFGLYHVQLQNLLPLASLGILMALLTWTSGSIWPAILAHFVNNAGGVITLKYFPESMIAEMSNATAPPVLLLLGSLVLSSILIYLLFTLRNVRSSKAPTI